MLFMTNIMQQFPFNLHFRKFTQTTWMQINTKTCKTCAAKSTNSKMYAKQRETNNRNKTTTTTTIAKQQQYQ